MGVKRGGWTLDKSEEMERKKSNSQRLSGAIARYPAGVSSGTENLQVEETRKRKVKMKPLICDGEF